MWIPSRRGVTLRRAAVTPCLLGLLSGCHEPVPQPPTPQERARLPSCRAAWAGLPPGAADYDLRRESQPTPEGNRGYQGYLARLQRHRCRKDWSVLVYMAADNDLAPYAYLNLYEMEAGPPRALSGPAAAAEPATATTVDTDVLVRLDTPGRTGLRRIHVFQSDQPYDPARPPAAFAQDTEAAIRSPLAALDPEPPVLDVAADLRDFLRWGISQYPAERYLVVVWGHGQGYGPGGDAPPVPDEADGTGPRRYQPEQDPFRPLRGGIAFNWTHGRGLGVPDLAGVLRDTVAGPLGGRPISVYLADACLMHSLEVTSELAGSAQYLVGSIQVQDYLGMAYRDLLRRLNSPPRAEVACAGDRDPAACAVAAAMPALYQAALHKGVRAGFPDTAATSFTLAALRTEALRDRLLPALAELARALLAYVEEDPLHAGSVRAVLGDPRRHSFQGNTGDLGEFLWGLAEVLRREEVLRRRQGGLTPAGLRVRAAVAAAQEALSPPLAPEGSPATGAPALLSARAGSDYAAARGFAGYSLWLPVAEDYRRRAATFRASAFFHNGRRAGAEQGPWPALLDRLYR